MWRFSVYCLAFCFEFGQSQNTQNKSSGNLCIQGKFILRLTFNPGLALTSFRITQHRLQVDLTCAHEKTSSWSAVNLIRLGLDQLNISARDMVTWCWSAHTLFWQVSIDHNMDPTSTSNTLVMITMRKSIHGVSFSSYMGMVLRLAVLWTDGAPLQCLVLAIYVNRQRHNFVACFKAVFAKDLFDRNCFFDCNSKKPSQAQILKQRGRVV